VALYCYSHSRGERFHHGLTFMTFDFGWFGKVAGGGVQHWVLLPLVLRYMVPVSR